MLVQRNIVEFSKGVGKRRPDELNGERRVRSMDKDFVPSCKTGTFTFIWRGSSPGVSLYYLPPELHKGDHLMYNLNVKDKDPWNVRVDNGTSCKRRRPTSLTNPSFRLTYKLYYEITEKKKIIPSVGRLFTHRREINGHQSQYRTKEIKYHRSTLMRYEGKVNMSRFYITHNK